MNDGLNYCKIGTCERIFNVCWCLNNFMVDQMERSCVWVGCGAPVRNDGVWLDGDTVLDAVSTEVTNLTLSLQFVKRCLLLVNVRIED